MYVDDEYITEIFSNIMRNKRKENFFYIKYIIINLNY